MPPFKIGLIGMGFGADVYVPAFLSVPDIVLSGVADGGSGRAVGIARGLSPMPRVFASGAELIASDAVEGVIVATPPRAQGALVRQALAVGKPVLSEKPLGLDLATAEALAAEAASRNFVAAAGFEFRYDPGIRLLRDAFLEGRIGPLERIDVAWITSGGLRSPRRWSWRNDIDEAGGVITDLAIHVIDYLRWISGEDIEHFRADADTRVRERIDSAGRPRPATSPDVVELLGTTRSGIRVNIAVSNAYTTALGHRIELTGGSGRLTFLHRPPFSAADVTVTLDSRDGSACLSDGIPGLMRTHHDRDTRVFACAELLRDFAGAVRGDRDACLPSFGDAAAARRLTHAIERATGYAA